MGSLRLEPSGAVDRNIPLGKGEDVGDLFCEKREWLSSS